jgi:superfamily II DNA or RNA helicase
MIESLPIKIVDNVFLEIESTQAQSYELSDYFSYFVKGYKFMPKYKFGQWDGKVRFFNGRSKQLPIGLLPELLKFCDRYQYQPEYKFDLDILKPIPFPEDCYKKFLEKMPLNQKYQIRDYQEHAFKKLIEHRRGVTQLNTGLGKSLVIYMLTNFILQQGKNILIIVPNITLVTQLYDDFRDYGFGDNVSKAVTRVYSGSKDEMKPVVISTWQSMFRKEKPFFDKFSAIVIDETHTLVNGQMKVKTKDGIKTVSGASIKQITEKCSNAVFRWGLTGTLSDDKCDMMTLRGYIGEVVMETRSSEYIEKGILSKMKVVNLFAKYPEELCKTVRKAKLQYNDELDFTLEYSGRNDTLDFILKCVKPDENVLLLVSKIEKQIKPLETYIREKYPDKKLYIIYGKTEGEEREEIRKTIEKETGCILLASYGTLSTGVNIRKLHHIIFFSSYKSKIKVLQSIGRGLRTHAEKTMLIVWDVVDDMRVGKFRNHLFKHWEERIKYYTEQGFKTINKEMKI